MLLVVDIGNTNVVLGIYDGPVLKAHWRLATDAKTTADEYGILFTNLLSSAGILPAQTSGAIMSSVVPTLTATFETLIEQYFGQRPLIVTSLSNVMDVRSFAPARHRRPSSGTKSVPYTWRPRTAGRLYSIAMKLVPTCCSTLVHGLRCG